MPAPSASLLPWLVTGLAVLFLTGTALHLYMREEPDVALAAPVAGQARPAPAPVGAGPDATPTTAVPPSQPDTSAEPLPAADIIISPTMPAAERSRPKAASGGPSFSCARATTDVELMICGSANLAALERQMSTLYGQIRSNRQLRRQVLVDQRLFLSQVAQCRDELCIEQMLRGRIDELSRY
ncbi:hypothetical protein GV829_13665 [Sphingomonas lacunae]|uniref:DUF1311 domain-containing protein n=1 Tax=Sphingomonas lacunae TaxID=2698828 RepID=A0A6M4AW41_9SPHN|nr:hypothetical protein [Sphingomonas lacunae]QJQ33357.1 hypothetical protein GV829_13665 [Sphingomonas lacunae]